MVAYNDDIAAVVVGAALRLGLKIADELAVIGHDDSPLAAMFVPSLSSIAIDNAGLGRLVAELALTRAEGRPLHSEGPGFRPSVVRRESS